jgi:hypothetical protein
MALCRTCRGGDDKPFFQDYLHVFITKCMLNSDSLQLNDLHRSNRRRICSNFWLRGFLSFKDPAATDFGRRYRTQHV